MTFFHKEVVGWVNPRRIYLDIELEVVDNADAAKPGLKTVKRYVAPLNPPAHGLIEDMLLNIGSSLLTKQDGLYGLQARYLHMTQHSTAAKKTFLNEFEGKKAKMSTQSAGAKKLKNCRRAPFVSVSPTFFFPTFSIKQDAIATMNKIIRITTSKLPVIEPPLTTTEQPLTRQKTELDV